MIHPDARGWLSEIVRESETGHIAQVYVTCCYPGVVKGWHRHKLQTDRMFCVSGMARIVIKPCDGWATEPEFREYVIGPLNPQVVVIPPGVWHGFTPAGNEPCLIVNCPDREYDGTDEERLSLDSIPYRWREIDG